MTVRFEVFDLDKFIAFVGASLLSTLDYRLGNEFVQRTSWELLPA